MFYLLYYAISSETNIMHIHTYIHVYEHVRQSYIIYPKIKILTTW